MDQPDPSWCARLRAASRPPRTAAVPPPDPGRRVVDRADFDPAYDATAPIACELCGAVMRYTGSCKITCGNCGYKRDCSDP